jgi:hypothetical protein
MQRLGQPRRIWSSPTLSARPWRYWTGCTEPTAPCARRRPIRQ